MAMKRKTKHDKQLGEWAKKSNKLLCSELENLTGLLPVAVNHIDYQHDICRFSVIFLKDGGDVLFHYLSFTDLYIALNESPDVAPVVSYIFARFTSWLQEYMRSNLALDEAKIVKQFYTKPHNLVFCNLIKGVSIDASN